MKNWPAILGAIMAFGVVLIVAGGAFNALIGTLVRMLMTLLGLGS